MTAVLTTPALRMPTEVPLGDYDPPPVLGGSMAERNSCAHWQHMGCLLDALEKARPAPAAGRPV